MMEVESQDDVGRCRVCVSPLPPLVTSYHLVHISNCVAVTLRIHFCSIYNYSGGHTSTTIGSLWLSLVIAHHLAPCCA